MATTSSTYRAIMAVYPCKIGGIEMNEEEVRRQIADEDPDFFTETRSVDWGSHIIFYGTLTGIITVLIATFFV